MFFKLKDHKNIQDDMVLMTRIVELTPISIVVTSTEGKIQYTNVCAENVLKFNREKIFGFDRRIRRSCNGARKLSSG